MEISSTICYFTRTTTHNVDIDNIVKYNCKHHSVIFRISKYNQRFRTIDHTMKSININIKNKALLLI